MNLKLKICGMKDPENTRLVALLKPDWLGFIFYPGSPRNFTGIIDQFNKVIPGEIGRVGVFVNEHPENVLRKVDVYNLDMIQLHGNETPEYCSHFRDKAIPLIKAIRINTAEDFKDLEKYENNCDYFLFETGGGGFGGTGKKFNWDLLEYYRGNLPFFLSGGIGPGDAGTIRKLNINGLFAIDINSRFEVSPGIKDIRLIEAFMQSINS